MWRRYLSSVRFVTLILVHLTALVGILSLWNVAEGFYFFLFLSVYLLGVFLDLKGVHPVKRFLLNLMAIFLSLYFLSFLSLENVIKPFSHLVLLLLAIKSLEEKKSRDLYQILLLSLFAVSISTIYNLSFDFLFVFLLHSFLGVSSFLFLNFYRTTGDRFVTLNVYRYLFISGAFLFLLVVLFTVPFFFLLPRTQAPLFDFVSREGGLKAGLADSVSLGKVGEIQEDNTVVMRVYGLPEGIKEPYWRVVVFGDYEKNTWIRLREDAFPLPEGQGEFVYTVVLEPSFNNMIPALDYPYGVLSLEGISASAYMATGNTLRLDREINRAVKLRLSSSRSLYLQESPEMFLRLPTDISPNLKRLAEEISRDAKSDEEKLRRVVEHFSRGYSYSMKLERYEGDPLDYFVFVLKRGNCEYFASATALLLRLMGVPARVVGGYRGALWNQYGGYYIVTNSMAHVWVEAYVNGRWVRVDTTPPYTPPALQKISTFALIRDAIVSFWYSNVVGYSSQKQIKLFRSIGEGIRAELSAENLKKKLVEYGKPLLAMLLLYSLYLLYRRHRKTPENLYRKTKELLVSAGIADSKALPEDLLLACKNTELYRHVKFIVLLYQKHRYSPYRLYPDELREGYRALRKLKELIRSFRRS